MFKTTDGKHHLVHDEAQDRLRYPQKRLTFSHSGSLHAFATPRSRAAGSLRMNFKKWPISIIFGCLVSLFVLAISVLFSEGAVSERLEAGLSILPLVFGIAVVFGVVANRNKSRSEETTNTTRTLNNIENVALAFGIAILFCFLLIGIFWISCSIGNSSPSCSF